MISIDVINNITITELLDASDNPVTYVAPQTVILTSFYDEDEIGAATSLQTAITAGDTNLFVNGVQTNDLNDVTGAPVESVNSEIGAVVLDANDVGADPAGTASTEVSNHEAAPDPHSQYTTTAEAGAAAPIQTVSGSQVNNGDPANPVIDVPTPTDIGLGNVDNTSDANKPVSGPQQTALDLKYDANNPDGFETPTELDARDTANRNRSNHTGTQTASTISDFDTEVANNTAVTANTAKNSYPAGDASKLAGIEAGAEVNQTDAEVKSQYEANANTNAFTDAEKSKLAALETSKFLGEFVSLAALQLAFPAPDPGSYANVDAGIGSDVERYVWDSTDNSYVLQLGESTQLTDAQIKTQYENNADTNAFTDAEQSKLAGIEANAKDDQNANEVPYSNGSSGLSATEVQGAIDEVEGRLDTAESEITNNGLLIGNNNTLITQETANRIAGDNALSQQIIALSDCIKLINTAVTGNLNVGVTTFNGLNTTDQLGINSALFTPAANGITCNFDGVIELDINVELAGAVARGCVGIRWANITQAVQGPWTRHTYIRNSSGHTESSANLSTKIAVSNGDLIGFQHDNFAGAGTITSPANGIEFAIRRVK